jgi:hypothetical protein
MGADRTLMHVKVRCGLGRVGCLDGLGELRGMLLRLKIGKAQGQQMFSALPSTTDVKATIFVSLVPIGSSYSFRSPKWVSFLEKLEFCARMSPTGPRARSARDLTTPTPWRLA